MRPWACLRGDREELARHPRVVGLGQLQVRERVLAVGVESRRHVEDLRPVRLERGEPVLAHRLAERVAPAARRERDVDHVRPERIHARVRVERVLERRDHQHPRIAREDVFGAVAVVHVEVDDGDALDAVDGERVRGADRDVVEQAEAHRAVALGVVTRRADRAEGAAALAARDQVGREDQRARRMQRGRQRMRAHRRVRIDVVEARGRALRLDRREVALAVDASQLLLRRGRRLVVA